MKKDLFIYAWNNLRHSLLRSTLTILSILIGIMAIFSLVSFGQGLSKYTNDIFEKMGSDKLIIQPKSFGPPGSGQSIFSDNDIEKIRRIPGVKTALGLSFTIGELKPNSKTKGKSVQTFSGEMSGREGDLFKTMLNVDPIEGRWLKKNEKGKVMLGYGYSKENNYFVDAIHAGDSVLINGIEMKVIGILDEIGNPDDDSSVILSQNYFQEIFQTDKYYMIYLSADNSVDVSTLEKRVSKELRKFRGQKEGQEDFFVQTFEDIMATSGTILGVINAIVIIIALISVFVAAINIMNTMYTSVLERTQEIGIMKAIGAKNSDILSIFLIESSFVGFIGGVLGILLGYGIAKFGGFLASSAGYSILQPYFPVWLFIASIIFATGIGALSGTLPAINASKQKPVDALRYE